METQERQPSSTAADCIAEAPSLDDSWFDWAHRRPSSRPPSEPLREPGIDPVADAWFR